MMRLRFSNKLALLWGLLLFLPGRAVWAEAVDEFSDHYQKGVTQFKAGDLEGAIRELRAAYAVKPLPRLLLNIATAHRRLGHAISALCFYELYLRLEPNPAPATKADLDMYMRQMRALLSESGRSGAESGAGGRICGKERRSDSPPLAPESQPQAAPPRAASLPQTALPKPAPVQGVARSPEPLPGSREERRRPAVRIAKWTLLGVGLAAVTAGAVLWGLNGQPACGLAFDPTGCPQHYDTWQGGVTLVMGGGAALVTSAVLFGLDHHGQREDARPAPVALVGRF